MDTSLLKFYQQLSDTLTERREDDVRFLIQQLRAVHSEAVAVAKLFGEEEFVLFIETYPRLSIGNLKRVIPARAKAQHITSHWSFAEILAVELGVLMTDTLDVDTGRWGYAQEHTWSRTELTQSKLRELSAGETTALHVLLGCLQLVPRRGSEMGAWWHPDTILGHMGNRQFVHVRKYITPLNQSANATAHKNS